MLKGNKSSISTYGIEWIFHHSNSCSKKSRFAATMNEVANANAEELRETMGPLDDIGGLGPMSRMCLLVAIIRNQSETLLLHTCVS